MQRLAVFAALLCLAGVVATCGTTSRSGSGDVVETDDADGSSEPDVPPDDSADSADTEDTAAEIDTEAPDGSGDASDDLGPDTSDTADGGEDPAGPYPSCDPAQGGACGEGSFCREVCPGDGSAVGFCTIPDRDSCGCGGVFDPCDTAGTTCLMPSCCDYWGLCVTPDEGDSICDGLFAEHFDCSGWVAGGGALPEGACRDHGDCSGPDFCQEPGYEIGCGACMEPEVTCESDDDCVGADGRPSICDWSRISDCLCSAAMICRPGCGSDGDCGPGEACGDDARCRPKACDGATDCPAAFDCVDGSCTRRSCTSDRECPGGHCVNGGCHDALGTCGVLPP